MSQIPLSSFTRRVLKAGYRRAYGKRYANIPPSQRVYVRPGEARAAQLRWSALLAAHRPTSLSAYAEKVPLGEIEEFLPCPMCENDTFRVLFHPGSRKRGAEWTYHVVRCERCGFLWRNPNIKPERLGRPLRGELQQVPHRRLCSEAAASLRLTMDAFSPLFKEGGGRRLLDFGCGTGLFLELAEQRGFDVAGCDLSQDSLDLAQRRLTSRKLYYGSPANVPELAAGGFDIVTMWSVLAHLPRPKDDLSMLRGLLNDDGALLILTVNAGSLMLKLHGSYWNGFTKNHLMFYSRDTLPRLLTDAGFAAVAFKPFYGDTIEAGTTGLSPENQARARRTVDETNGGNMMRAVAFASTDAAAASGLQYQSLPARSNAPTGRA
jgi:2-polyprenyl-3-methyl-5-hydroxy-6-metoxy-1,4-benzoquinol methylase